MKKLFFLPLLIFLSSVFLTAHAAPKDLAISVSKGTLKIGTAKISGTEWQISSVTGLLTGTVRAKEGYNKTHTYDEMGILLFEPMVDEKPSGRLAEVQVFFGGYNENERSPNSSFKGTVKIGKLKINSSNNITPAVMRKKLKGWEESDSYMEHVYRFEQKGIYIYVKFNDAETKIVKLSIGPAKKK